MTKVLTNSQGKIYINQAGKALVSEMEDIITATNNTGSAISAGDKVWINENNGSYSIDSFNAGTINCTVVGSPFFYKGAVTSFSRGNYLTASSSLCEIGNTFYYHFRTGATPSSVIRLYTLETFDALLENSSTRNLLVYSWSTQQFTTLMTVSNNTEYWLRVRTSAGQRSYAISTDGTTYGAETVITDTTYGPQPSGTFYWGCNSNNEFWNGYIYLEDCFITNSNGIEIWRAYEPNVNKNTLTGYAKENIASGSTGDVKTVLGA